MPDLAKRLYRLLGIRNQALLGRLRYRTGLLPRAGITRFPRAPWPQPYRACLLLSADLELAWAWRYDKRAANSQAYALRHAAQARRNMPDLLALFERHRTPVTWAVVGHLLLDRCQSEGGKAHPELERVPHFENEYWRYLDGDWFDADPCCAAADAPAWYAPDLLRAIMGAGVKHEVACHSFSHVDLSTGVCPPQVADGELRACRQAAKQWGLELGSFVFPGNLVGNLASLKRHGFTAYRWHSRHELDLPRQDDLGLWKIPGGVCWEKPEGWPVAAWVEALQRSVDRALQTGTVLHLWFHPSCEPINVEVVFPALLDYVALCGNDLWVTTMAGLVKRLTAAGGQARWDALRPW